MEENVVTNWLKENAPENYEELLKKTNEIENGDFNLKIKIVNNSDNDNPKYESLDASGFDIRANLTEPISIGSLDRVIIPTGLFMDIPRGFELQIRPRSGLAAKYGITVLNSPGTVDSDYVGEIKIILINLSRSKFTINNGDRIAQGVLSVVSNFNIFNFEFVDKIEKKTERGISGFGSTGIS